MLSFRVKFMQTDKQTTVKQYAPNLSIQGHKNELDSKVEIPLGKDK